jgi:hypothetical protein
MTVIVDGTNGITYPNGSGAQAAPGKILQVVNATYGVATSTTSTTLSDTGLTASITPLFATSKVLIFVNVNGCFKGNTDTALQLVLLRSSTQILLMDDLIAYTGSTTLNAVGSSSASYLDSPATTSSTTYKVQFATGTSGRSVTVQNYNSLNGNTKSTMTLMEIAA